MTGVLAITAGLLIIGGLLGIAYGLRQVAANSRAGGPNPLPNGGPASAGDPQARAGDAET